MTDTSSVHEAGQSNLAFWDNPEGWCGEGNGRAVQDGGIHVHRWVIHIYVWLKPPQYVIILQLTDFLVSIDRSL